MPLSVSSWSPRLVEFELARDIGCLLAMLPIGRIVLSFLPAGQTGGHSARQLPLTVAVSLALGCASAALASHFARERGESMLWLILATLAVVGAVRWWLRPHALMPGRELDRARAGAAALGVRGATLALCIVAIVRAPQDNQAWGASAALLVLAEIVRHGLLVARRNRLGVELVALAVVALATPTRAVDLDVINASIAVAFGASFSIAWLRCADRRARTLALLGFAATSWSLPMVGVAGLVAMTLATHRNSRASTAKAAVFAALFVALPIGLASGSGFPGVESLPTHDGAMARVVFLATCSLMVIGLVAFAAGLRGGERNPRFELGKASPPIAEVRALAIFVALAIVLQTIEQRVVGSVVSVVDRSMWEGLFMALTPATCTLIGLTTLRSERS